MKFSVIYSLDVPAGTNVHALAPPNLDDWTETEDDGQYEYSYLEGRWTQGHHRKWAAILNRADFDRFVDQLGLFAEDVQTLGSIGAPGCGYGWVPAISFTSRNPDAIQIAYVTPLPDVRRQELGEHDWDRVRSAVLAVYG